MKHFYLFLGLVLLSFVACDNEINPLQPQAEEAYIRFDVVEEEWPTKGTTTDGTSIRNQSLGVLAYNITGSNTMESSTPSLMYNIPVSIPDGSTAWTYSEAKRWPTSGTVNFFAYAPYEEPATSGVTHFKLSDKSATDYPSITYRMNDQSNNHRDLLVASALGRTKERGVVPFKFKHALARIHFTAKLKDGCSFTDVTITQVSIKSSSFKNVGTLTFTETEGGFNWDNLYRDISTDILMSSDELNQNSLKTDDYVSVTKDDKGYLFLIPQTAELQLKVYYTFTDGSNQKQGISPVTLSEIAFEAGKAYNCQFELNPQPMTGDIPGEEYTELAALKNNSNGYILLDISPNGNDMGVKMRLKYDNAVDFYTYPLAVMSGKEGQSTNQIRRRFYFLGKHKESDGTIYFQVGWDNLYGRLDKETLPYNSSDVLLAEFHYLNQNEIAITYPSSPQKQVVTDIYERGNSKNMNLSDFFQAEVSSDLPISLFGTTMNDNTGSAEFKVEKPWCGTIYEVWISKGTEDILHLKPVQRKSDNVYGMYDVIGAEFYPCHNSSSFEAIAKPSEEGTTE